MMTRLMIALLALASLAAGQNPATAAYPTTIATDTNLLAAKDLSTSTLTSNINNSTTSVPVADGTQFIGAEIIRVDNEQMRIVSIATNTLTVSRAFGGTSAASHLSGAAVRGIITASHHNQLAAEMKAVQAWLRDYSGGCQDAVGTDAYACTLSPPAAAYVTGGIYRLKAATANTGQATVDFSGIGPKTIKKTVGGITTDLSDNDIRAGAWVLLIYDGTNMQLASQLGNGGGGDVTSGGNNTFTGTNSFAAGKFIFPTVVAGSLPAAASSTNMFFWVTDTVGASCSGGGTTPTLCASNGTVWHPASFTPITGTGIGVSCVHATGLCTISIDSSVLTKAVLQAGTPQYCRSTTGSDAYDCTLTPAITSYTRGMCLALDADTANTGTASLRANGVAYQPVVNRAGTLATGDIPANIPSWVCYDGTNWVLQGDGGSGAGDVTQAGTNTYTGTNDFSGGKFKFPEKTVATLPSAASNTNFMYWVTDGAPGGGDCVTGSGSTRTLCYSNGSVWLPVSPYFVSGLGIDVSCLLNICTPSLSDMFRNNGSPEGVVTGSVGQIYQRADGGTGTSLYIKESGTGNTGWVAVAVGAGTGDMLLGTAQTSTAKKTFTTQAGAAGLATTCAAAPSSLANGEMYCDSGNSNAVTFYSKGGKIVPGVLAGQNLTCPIDADGNQTCGLDFTPGTGVTAFLANPTGPNFNTMVPGGVPIAQSSKSADYTLVLTDGGTHLLHPLADNNPRTFTIPANASVAFPVGTTITFVNQVNTVTIAITSDTLQLAGTATTGSRTIAAGGMGTAIKVTSTLWFLSGPGVS